MFQSYFDKTICVATQVFMSLYAIIISTQLYVNRPVYNRPNYKMADGPSNIIEYFARFGVNSDVSHFCISLYLLIATKSVTINNYLTRIVKYRSIFLGLKKMCERKIYVYITVPQILSIPPPPLKRSILF